jgi:hypothetical protein
LASCSFASRPPPAAAAASASMRAASRSPCCSSSIDRWRRAAAIVSASLGAAYRGRGTTVGDRRGRGGGRGCVVAIAGGPEREAESESEAEGSDMGRSCAETRTPTSSPMTMPMLMTMLMNDASEHGNARASRGIVPRLHTPSTGSRAGSRANCELLSRRGYDLLQVDPTNARSRSVDRASAARNAHGSAPHIVAKRWFIVFRGSFSLHDAGPTMISCDP